ncbi:MAG TPA: hypothetical protein VJ998_11570, partial [Pseudomonadales bacterium]|nr:hypothetical protein [Pseudomonadales bacterium]
MTLQLAEGQDFSANYSLLQRLAVRDYGERWLALDKTSSERVVLQIFDAPLSNATREQVERAIDTGRGLIHPNITRVYRLERGEGHDFIVSQYISPEQNFTPDTKNFSARWPQLEQLFDALTFAHSLGVAHGHIHPGNLLIDSRGHLHVTDFGLPSHAGNTGHEAWLSPQIRSGASPDFSDDIYGLGYLLYFGLTGKAWRNEKFET